MMKLPRSFRGLGPGMAMAATGVGAGDLVAAMFGGARFGEAILWAVVVGALVKLAINEGIARWQFATATPLLEGWCRYLGRPFRIYFLVYLVGWSFIVGGALMSACGVAAHALAPGFSISVWAVLHSLAALALVLIGRYGLFEAVMSVFVALMFATLLGSVAFFMPDPKTVVSGLIVPTLPPGSPVAIMALIGGVGGSVTLLAYGYWIRERGWVDRAHLRRVRVDLAVAYALTGLFGMAVLIIASGALGSRADELPGGSAGLVALADALGHAVGARLGAGAGAAVRTLFLVGVWGAVFTSILGVWQGVPYLFADFRAAFAGRFGEAVDVRSRDYRGFLLYLAFAPMVLLAFSRPIWLIVAYTVLSSTFMPFLAGSLLWLNSRRSLVGDLRNGLAAAVALGAAVLIMGFLAVRQVWNTIGGS